MWPAPQSPNEESGHRHREPLVKRLLRRRWYVQQNRPENGQHGSGQQRSAQVQLGQGDECDEAERKDGHVHKNACGRSPPDQRGDGAVDGWEPRSVDAVAHRFERRIGFTRAVVTSVEADLGEARNAMPIAHLVVPEARREIAHSGIEPRVDENQRQDGRHGADDRCDGQRRECVRPRLADPRGLGCPDAHPRARSVLAS